MLNSEIGEKIMQKVGEEGGFVLLGPSNRGARVMTSNKKLKRLKT